MSATKKKTPRAPRSQARERSEKLVTFAGIDAKGEVYGYYPTEQEAFDDAVGPRFRPSITIAKLVQVSVRSFRSDEPYTLSKRARKS